jgi:hypothetical protein
VAYLRLVRRMAPLLGLFTLSVAVALIVVWFIVTREVPRVRAVILAVAALTIVSAICAAVGYLGLRVHISYHYEINLVMLRFFVIASNRGWSDRRLIERGDVWSIEEARWSIKRLTNRSSEPLTCAKIHFQWLQH